MLVTEKGDELCDFSDVQSTPLESHGVDLGYISPDVLQSFNLAGEYFSYLLLLKIIL